MKEARKRTPMIITFRKSTKTISATADAENFALLAECTQNNCGRRCLLSAVLVRKSPY
jgi:hypothetical protein